MRKQIVIFFTWLGAFIIRCGAGFAEQNDSIRNSNSHTYGSGWSAAHADGGNTDYSPTIGPRNITLAWQRKFPGTINLGPTNNMDGQVYMTTSGGGCHLYALDSKTGETLWCSDEVNKFAVSSSALLDRDGRLFLADNEAMHAFNSSGELLWETPIEGFPFSAQFTQTGKLIFITCIGKIYVMDRNTGKNILEPYPDLKRGNSLKPSQSLHCKEKPYRSSG